MDAYLVDAFADEPFGGNPAGVVLLAEPRDEAWMQRVAAELKHSETAFVDLMGAERPGDPLPLRWFTPTVEVELCGHATLAAAHVLGGDVRFVTRSGVLACQAAGDGWVRMDFPADPPRPLDPAEPEAEAITRALGDLPVTAFARGVSDLLVQVSSEDEVRAVRPDLGAIASLPARGLVVTAAAGNGREFVSRCFYPAAGIDEDPVTGSAHCLLACWWSGRLDSPELMGRQLSARGGRVAVHHAGDRVFLVGRAFTVLSGRLHV